MPGILLDTHALYWLVTGAETLTDGALIAIGECQSAGTLYVSPITAWELSLAAQKPAHRDPPRLGSPIATWFRAAVRVTSAKIVPIQQKIATAAAEVPVAKGHKDRGDCFLIATARVRGIPLVSRDLILRDMADHGYIDVIVC